MSLFDSAFAIVVGLEGGYVSDPKDPGGETKWGISKRAYPDLDIANLTLEEAKAIYQRDYWDLCGCDSYPWDRALCLFDCAVNQGPSFARSINAASQDAVDLMAERALRYAQTMQFQRFGRGWMRRLFSIMKQAQVTP